MVRNSGGRLLATRGSFDEMTALGEVYDDWNDYRWSQLGCFAGVLPGGLPGGDPGCADELMVTTAQLGGGDIPDSSGSSESR